LSFDELRELQRLLVRAGYDVGKVDGIMGQLSRSAVKAMQVKYGLPADSWPSAELLARMRGTAPTAEATPPGVAAVRAPRAPTVKRASPPRPPQ
jgi:peptidoglycan hydrolase-like protein with peptidoglycan-binding domain